MADQYICIYHTQSIFQSLLAFHYHPHYVTLLWPTQSLDQTKVLHVEVMDDKPRLELHWCWRKVRVVRGAAPHRPLHHSDLNLSKHKKSICAGMVKCVLVMLILWVLVWTFLGHHPAAGENLRAFERCSGLHCPDHQGPSSCNKTPILW